MTPNPRAADLMPEQTVQWWRHAVSIVLLPVTVVVVVPMWITRSVPSGDIGTDRALMVAGMTLGTLLFAVGFALFAWCVALFARVGRGTLAPWDPTHRVVAVGPYRYVRNPMISAVAGMLAGEALFLGSVSLAAWSAAFVRSIISTLFWWRSRDWNGASERRI